MAEESGWKYTAGLITALAALITAVTGALALFTDVFRGDPPQPPPEKIPDRSGQAGNIEAATRAPAASQPEAAASTDPKASLLVKVERVARDWYVYISSNRIDEAVAISGFPFALGKFPINNEKEFRRFFGRDLVQEESLPQWMSNHILVSADATTERQRKYAEPLNDGIANYVRGVSNDDLYFFADQKAPGDDDRVRILFLRRDGESYRIRGADSVKAEGE